MARWRTLNRRRKRLVQAKAWTDQLRSGKGGKRRLVSPALAAHHARYGATWYRWKRRNLLRMRPWAVQPVAIVARTVILPPEPWVGQVWLNGKLVGLVRNGQIEAIPPRRDGP